MVELNCMRGYSARFADVNAVEESNSVAAVRAKVLWGVDVAFRQRPVQSRWADFEWEPVSAEISEPVSPLQCETIELNGECQWLWRGCEMDLHPSEGEGYWLNLTSQTPCIFVMWRMDEGETVPRPAVVTASYNEAGRMLDAGDRVDRVPMPEVMQSALAEYTMQHYKPEVRKKMKRNERFWNQGSREEKARE
jgi:Protein of unknown function (DUF3305)